LTSKHADTILGRLSSIGWGELCRRFAAMGVPGKAIEKAVEGSAKNWYTLQAASYMFF
jgi:hypothetical protein